MPIVPRNGPPTLRLSSAPPSSARPSSARRSLATLFATACTLYAAVGHAQSPTPPEILRAQSALRAGHADSAIIVLESFFAQHPTATIGRLLLGNAYRQNRNFDKALTTYTAIVQPRPQRLQAMFNAAGIYAVQHQADSAFRLLRDLKATGAFDMAQTRTSNDFAAVRTDPRFASVQFQPADFVHPFVEPVHVLHEWVGEAAGDQFSWIARGIGDVDGDGASDVVTSAPTFGANGQPSGPGKVYLYSGRTGALLWSRVGDSTEALGTGLEGAGDANADGVADVIAGAPGSNRAYVFSGRDGHTLFTLRGTGANERFGASAAGAGDQNGDGYADVIVGAPGFSGTAPNAGRASVFSGRDGTLLFTIDGDRANDALGSIVAGVKRGTRTPILVGAPGAGAAGHGQVRVYDGPLHARKFVIDADRTGGALGAMFTSIVGDVNGDNVPDVYAADFSDGANGPSTGRVYIHSGADGSRLYRFTGEHASDGFGIGSADVGDVNNDGYDDLLVGAWQYSAVAPSGGRVYLYSGKDGTVLRTITGRVAGETLGFDATGIGDVNGDGVIDLLVTSSWSNVAGFRSGRMYIVSGK